MKPSIRSMYRKNEDPFDKEKRIDGRMLDLVGVVSQELKRRLSLKVGNRALEEGLREDHREVGQESAFNVYQASEFSRPIQHIG